MRVQVLRENISELKQFLGNDGLIIIKPEFRVILSCESAVISIAEGEWLTKDLNNTPILDNNENSNQTRS